MNLNNLYNLTPTYLALNRNMRRQKAFVKKLLEPEIEVVKKYNDGSLDEDDYNKIRKYYGFGVPAIVGEGFCTLRGKKMSKRERLASTYQGALTGLYDDFFDKTGLAHDKILQMMQDPSGYHPTTSLEQLFIHFLTNVNKNISDRDQFNEAFRRVFEVQVESKKQSGKGMTFDQVRQVTLDKGGYSLLFYRSVFDTKAGTKESDAWYNTGALMQLGNDIFDVWKDAPQKVSTLLTTCNKIEQVRNIFDEQLDTTIFFLKRSGFRKKNIHKYLHKLVLGISRCYVCLDQLEMLEKKTNGIFSPSSYTREEMVCDMEKPRNMMRSIRYYLDYKI